MIRKDNIVKIIVAIILIVGAIVLLANNTIKWSGNNNESLNSALNVENIEDTNYLQDVGNTVNPYLEKQEDGQIENNSPELKREKQFKEIEINNIKFVYNPGNKMTTITADLKNVGTEEQKQEIVEIKITGQNGEELARIEALIPNIKVGETKILRCSATADLSNARDFEIIEK